MAYIPEQDPNYDPESEDEFEQELSDADNENDVWIGEFILTIDPDSELLDSQKQQLDDWYENKDNYKEPPDADENFNRNN